MLQCYSPFRILLLSEQPHSCSHLQTTSRSFFFLFQLFKDKLAILSAHSLSLRKNPLHSVSLCGNWLSHLPYAKIEIFLRGSQDFVLAPFSSYLTASDLFQICNSYLRVKYNGLLVPLLSVNACCIFVLMLEVFSKKWVFVMISV